MTDAPADGDGAVPVRPDETRVREAALWGVVGTLAFGVLHQAYLLLGGRFLGIPPVVAIALGVGVVSGVAAYLLAGRLPAPNGQD